jgi:hypothetical protein
MIASICKRELEREALGKLPRLAAKGAYLEPGDAGTRAVLNLMSPRNDHSAPVAKWERDLVDAFHRYGWVEHDPLGRTVLSNGGRAWLAGRGVKRVAAKAAHRMSAQRPQPQKGRSSGVMWAM